MARSRCRAGRQVLALDGRPGPWLRGAFEVIPQRGGATTHPRIADAFADAGVPGAADRDGHAAGDAPRCSSARWPRCAAPGVPTRCWAWPSDGGWWALGLRRADPRVLRRRADEPRRHRTPPARAGCPSWACARRCCPTLRDVDVIDDALAVAAHAPEHAVRARPWALTRCRTGSLIPGARSPAARRGPAARGRLPQPAARRAHRHPAGDRARRRRSRSASSPDLLSHFIQRGPALDARRPGRPSRSRSTGSRRACTC